MSQIDLRTFRRHLAVISQQTILFNGTLRENVAYGTKNVSEGELEAALAHANAINFIKELPHGLETEIGPSGVQLSGGQRQRIAIARALLRDPRVPGFWMRPPARSTASASQPYNRRLPGLMAGRTTIYHIAHHQNILSNVHRTITLVRGEMK